MASNKYYYITKKGKDGDIIFLDYKKLTGYNVTPKNTVDYDGIEVNKLVIIKQSFIEKLLKKKIKRKLDLYLQIIADMIDDDTSSDDTALRETLNELTRYKDIVRSKYEKYLDERYIRLLYQKIEALEYELSSKLTTRMMYRSLYNQIYQDQIYYEDENISRKSR